MTATLATTIAFGSSDRLAGAYGTAVATTMLLTTGLLYKAMRDVWKWPAIPTAAVISVFLVVDLAFFSANLLKIADGGWLPLTLAAALFVVMVTWRTGIEAMHAALLQTPETVQRFLSQLAAHEIPRIDGTTVFITRSNQRVSRLIVDHAHYTGVLPKRTVALSIRFDSTPRIVGPKCTVVEKIGEGVWLLAAHFGFFEIPDLRAALNGAQGLESPIDFDGALFVAARDLIVPKPHARSMQGWRVALFAFLYRNSAKIVDRFNLPPERVVEIARQIEI
jgi:KUP system potassium uptake protein